MGCEAVFENGWRFNLKGSLKIFYGLDHELKEAILKAGDFGYIPRGEIHGFMNMSKKETAE
jgi:uncharacterized RmlC-like cupin family protein